MRTLVCTVVLCAFAGLAAAQAPGQAPAQAPGRQGPPTPKNLQVFPKDIAPRDLIAHMRTIAASLGVRCNFCHVQGDFSSDQKDTKLIARKMLRMVNSINQNNFDGRPEVSCYTCHRGAMKPVSQVPPEAGRGPGGPGGPGRGPGGGGK